MSQLVKHLKVSAIPDGPDPNQINPSDWNASHVFSGGALGGLLMRDTGDATYGASWIASVAAGSVLISNGVGAAPTWAASLTLNSLTLSTLTVNGNAALIGPSPTLVLYDTGQPANSRYFYLSNQAGLLQVLAVSDVGATQNTPLLIGRAGGVVVGKRVSIGGSTNAYPAIRNTGANLDIVLADESQWAGCTALKFVAITTGSSLPDLTLGGNLTLAADVLEKGRTTALGTWINVAASGTAWFSAGGPSNGNWAEGTVNTFAYTLVGYTLTMVVYVTGGTLYTSYNTLNILIPGGKTASRFACGTASVNGEICNCYVLAGQTWISIVRNNTANFAVGAITGAFIEIAIPIS